MPKRSRSFCEQWLRETADNIILVGPPVEGEFFRVIFWSLIRGKILEHLMIEHRLDVLRELVTTRGIMLHIIRTEADLFERAKGYWP